MKRFSLSIVLVLVSVVVLAQIVTQKGVAYRYNGKQQRTPLGKVYIKVATAPNGVLSDSVNGAFQLQFPASMKMGSGIGSVRVTKRGMMIFNQQAVDEWNIRKEPLRLILCDADEFERQKQALIETGRREAKKRYDKKLEEIKANYDEETTTYYEHLSRLEEENTKLLEMLNQSAEEIARIDLSELDGKMQEIIDLYNE